MRETTPFASFLPLNGYLHGAGARATSTTALIFPNNLRNKPIFVVNGGRDPLYPDARRRSVRRAPDSAAASSIDYHPQPDAATQHRVVAGDEGHRSKRSSAAHPRKPLPDTLTWETATAPNINRAHWLVIDRLGAREDDAKSLADLNEMPMPPSPDFGVRSRTARASTA